MRVWGKRGGEGALTGGCGCVGAKLGGCLHVCACMHASTHRCFCRVHMRMGAQELGLGPAVETIDRAANKVCVWLGLSSTQPRVLTAGSAPT